MGTSSIKDELLTLFDFDRDTPTTSAFVQQRQKILPSAFEALLNDFNQAFPIPFLHKGLRLLAFDGSSVPIFADPNDLDNFTQTKPDVKGYSNLHLNACYDLLSQRYVDAIIQSDNLKNETLAMNTMVDRFESLHKAVFIADRYYESYNVFAHALESNNHFLIRAKDIHSNGIAKGLLLPDEDEFDIDVSFIITHKQTNHVKENPRTYKIIKKERFDFFTEDSPYYHMSFRVVRFKITDDSYEVIITSLDRDEFSSKDIKELYNMRWGIESAFRQLKHVVGLNYSHAKKVDSIKQEIFACLILHNFCEIITSNIVIQQKDTKYPYQINATRAFRICRHFLRFSSFKRPLDVEALISKELLPVRPNRNFSRKSSTRKSFSFLYRAS